MLWHRNQWNVVYFYVKIITFARYVLAIPASSSTSGRYFSAGGLTVTKLRCSLARWASSSDDKIEGILKIRLNLQKLEDMESKLKIVPIEFGKHNENDVDEPISDSDWFLLLLGHCCYIAVSYTHLTLPTNREV